MFGCLAFNRHGVPFIRHRVAFNRHETLFNRHQPRFNRVHPFIPNKKGLLSDVSGPFESLFV